MCAIGRHDSRLGPVFGTPDESRNDSHGLRGSTGELGTQTYGCTTQEYSGLEIAAAGILEVRAV
jgi:hypothetical protein